MRLLDDGTLSGLYWWVQVRLRRMVSVRVSPKNGAELSSPKHTTTAGV